MSPALGLTPSTTVLLRRASLSDMRVVTFWCGGTRKRHFCALPGSELPGRVTCGHVLQHLQQHVLGLVDELGPLQHQLPQAQVPIQHSAYQAALKMPLDGFHLYKGGEKACGDRKSSRKICRTQKACAIQRNKKIKKRGDVQ